MRKKCEGLIAKLESDLEQVDLLQLMPIEKLKSNLSVINFCLREMKSMVAHVGFITQTEEIEFFKVWKPKVYGRLVFAIEKYNFEIARPIQKSTLSVFYQEQLNFISRFLRQNEFMYQYFKMGLDELDHIYFIRGNFFDGLVSSGVPELDASFATPGDYLFSKFIGTELMQRYLVEEINSGMSSEAFELESKKGRKLKWTGDSTNLIELLYGLFETKQFNDGEVDIADLVDVFEQVFHINLSNYFRRFTTIKRRKSISKTRFLDEMVSAVAKRIDDADAYVPASMR